jgi:hypothetical protein
VEARTGGSRGRRSRRSEEETEGKEGETVVLHLPQIDPELKEWIRGMLPLRSLLRVLRDPPEEMLTHARAARRERLLAIRSVIDTLIEDAERPLPSRRAREIEIE